MREEHLAARPSPVPDAESEPFFEAASRSELLLRHCRACGTWAWPVPRYATCHNCLTPGLEWKRASGAGVVHAVTRVHYVPADDDPSWAPFMLGVVELDEGVRTQIVGLLAREGNEARVGDPVRAVFSSTRDDVHVPWFEVSGNGNGAERNKR
jgi:uncharacterized OB-fold protein